MDSAERWTCHYLTAVFLFVQGCLQMDPTERLTCHQLLQHPYMDLNMEMVTEGKRDTVNRNKNKSRTSNYPMVSGVKVYTQDGLKHCQNVQMVKKNTFFNMTMQNVQFFFMQMPSIWQQMVKAQWQ